MNPIYPLTLIHIAAMSPTMLQLVPLVSVLSGLVATLVVVAICVVFVLRCREKNKRNKETSKMSTVKQHSLNHSTDSLDNNPDIIPLSSGQFANLT